METSRSRICVSLVAKKPLSATQWTTLAAAVSRNRGTLNIDGELGVVLGFRSQRCSDKFLLWFIENIKSRRRGSLKGLGIAGNVRVNTNLYRLRSYLETVRARTVEAKEDDVGKEADNDDETDNGQEAQCAKLLRV